MSIVPNQLYNGISISTYHTLGHIHLFGTLSRINRFLYTGWNLESHSSGCEFGLCCLLTLWPGPITSLLLSSFTFFLDKKKTYMILYTSFSLLAKREKIGRGTVTSIIRFVLEVKSNTLYFQSLIQLALSLCKSVMALGFAISALALHSPSLDGSSNVIHIYGPFLQFSISLWPHLPSVLSEIDFLSLPLPSCYSSALWILRVLCLRFPWMLPPYCCTYLVGCYWAPFPFDILNQSWMESRSAPRQRLLACVKSWPSAALSILWL